MPDDDDEEEILPRVTTELDVTTNLETGRHAARVRRLTLRVCSGPDSGMVHDTTGERTVIGTHRSPSLQLSDRAVSRFHCEVELAGPRITLTDLGSRNGTYVDGVRVEKCLLHAHAQIAVGKTQLRVELRSDVAELPLSERSHFGTMVGESLAMRRVFALLERASQSDATVLLTGETGTGKEAAAESIHEESPRREGPFIVVDCGAIPETLLESELFGHEKGSFTGATGQREGAFQAADGGTVFLDEIGELPIDLQPKLLRVLEKRQVKRVGASIYKPVDVRVVAATNRNLRAEVNQRTFRSDLYYRLAVIEVRLPPLRERVEDLPVLCERLLEGRTDVQGETARFLHSPGFMASLVRHPWTGNVRELRNHLERCIALQEAVALETSQEGPAMSLDQDVPEVDVTRPYSEARKAWLRTFERRYLEALLAAHGGNVSAAARAARLDRAQLYRLLWRTGLRERRDS
ncbi:MAG: sigma 54-interacting transcriptional regulator [Sandaracinaceae bacterium]